MDWAKGIRLAMLLVAMAAGGMSLTACESDDWDWNNDYEMNIEAQDAE